MTDSEVDMSARASELRWRWRMIVLDLLLDIAAEVGLGVAILTERMERAKQLRRDLECAG